MSDLKHTNINETAEKIKELEAERLTLKLEIEKRKHDLRMHNDVIPEHFIEVEKAKIEELEDSLEDLEFDLVSYVQHLFELVGAMEEDVEQEFLNLLGVDESDAKKEQEEKIRLIAIRDKAEHDLKLYQKCAEEKLNELSTLQDLIDATETELEEAIADLYELG